MVYGLRFRIYTPARKYHSLMAANSSFSKMISDVSLFWGINQYTTYFLCVHGHSETLTIGYRNSYFVSTENSLNGKN